MPKRFIAIIAVLIPTAACGGTLGPLVTDVAWGEHGEIVVTRCMLEISSAGNVTTYEMNKCTRSTHPAPSSSVAVQPPMPVAAPHGSSATTIAQ